MIDASSLVPHDFIGLVVTLAVIGGIIVLAPLVWGVFKAVIGLVLALIVLTVIIAIFIFCDSFITLIGGAVIVVVAICVVIGELIEHFRG